MQDGGESAFQFSKADLAILWVLLKKWFRKKDRKKEIKKWKPTVVVDLFEDFGGFDLWDITLENFLQQGVEFAHIKNMIVVGVEFVKEGFDFYWTKIIYWLNKDVGIKYKPSSLNLCISAIFASVLLLLPKLLQYRRSKNGKMVVMK